MFQPHKRHVFGLLLALFVVYLLDAQAPTNNTSQQTAIPPIKVETRVVLVDVIVTNGKGETIPGLRQESLVSKRTESRRPSRPSTSTNATPPHPSASVPCLPTSTPIFNP